MGVLLLLAVALFIASCALVESAPPLVSTFNVAAFAFPSNKIINAVNPTNLFHRITIIIFSFSLISLSLPYHKSLSARPGNNLNNEAPEHFGAFFRKNSLYISKNNMFFNKYKATRGGLEPPSSLRNTGLATLRHTGLGYLVNALFQKAHKDIDFREFILSIYIIKDISNSILDTRIEFAYTFLNHIKVIDNK